MSSGLLSIPKIFWLPPSTPLHTLHVSRKCLILSTPSHRSVAKSCWSGSAMMCSQGISLIGRKVLRAWGKVTDCFKIHPDHIRTGFEPPPPVTYGVRKVANPLLPPSPHMYMYYEMDDPSTKSWSSRKQITILCHTIPSHQLTSHEMHYFLVSTETVNIPYIRQNGPLWDTQEKMLQLLKMYVQQTSDVRALYVLWCTYIRHPEMYMHNTSCVPALDILKCTCIRRPMYLHYTSWNVPAFDVLRCTYIIRIYDVFSTYNVLYV